MDSRVCICVDYLEDNMATGCTTGGRYAGGGDVMLWVMFYWEKLGPTLLHPFMASVLLCTAMVQESFKVHDKEWPPVSPDLI